MFNSFTKLNGETLDNSYFFSDDFENSLINSNNFLLASSLPNLDKPFEMQSEIGREKNESESSLGDRLNIEIPSHNIYSIDNTVQQKDKNLFSVHKDRPLRGRKRKIENNSVRKHNKYSEDNINRKLQVNSINFIIKYINLILLRRGIDI